jgi:hypothetical protein
MPTEEDGRRRAASARTTGSPTAAANPWPRIYLPRYARALMRARQLGGEIKYLSQGEIAARNRYRPARDSGGAGILSSRSLYPPPSRLSLYASGGTKPPISAASSRANSIVVESSPSGPMI